MAGAVYAELADFAAHGRQLTAAQQAAAETLLSEASAMLRVRVRQYGKDLDAMLSDPVTGEDNAQIARSIVIQAVCRALDSVDSTTAVTQGTESIGAYSLTTNYLNAGQSMYFLNNELKLLGLRRQTYGAIELYRTPQEDT